MNWFRWYHNATSDPKFTVIARKSGRQKAEVIAVWAALLEHASEAETRGCIEDVDPEIIAACLDMDDDAVTAIMSAMIAKGMICDGAITAWNRRQVIREDDSSERVRAFRDRKKQNEKQEETHGNAVVTHGNAQVTPQIRTDKSRTDTEHTPLVCVFDNSVAHEAPPPNATHTHDGGAGIQIPTPQLEPPMPQPAEEAKPLSSGIPDDWEPKPGTVDVIAGYGIDTDFIADCVPHFVLYHREAGTERPGGFESLFVGWVKTDWTRRGQARAGEQATTKNGMRVYANRQEARMTIAEWRQYQHDLHDDTPEPFPPLSISELKPGGLIRAH